MRKALLPVTAAVCLFLIGVFILNMQLWHSSSTETLEGARYAAKNMDNILDEAFQATRTAKNIAEKNAIWRVNTNSEPKRLFGLICER